MAALDVTQRVLSPSRPVIIELVGLPGTGKTTLCKELLRSAPDTTKRARMTKGVHNFALVARSIRLLIPFLSQYSRMQQRPWNKLALMLQLEALKQFVANEPTSNAQILVLDQGPVYLLSILHRALATDPSNNSQRFLRYWQTTLSTWSQNLDVIVQLEAPDDLLYRRIRARGTRHPVCNMPEEEARRFFERSRTGRNRILAELQRFPARPTIFSLRTDRMSLDEAVTRIGAAARPKHAIAGVREHKQAS